MHTACRTHTRCPCKRLCSTTHQWLGHHRARHISTVLKSSLLSSMSTHQRNHQQLVRTHTPSLPHQRTPQPQLLRIIRLLKCLRKMNSRRWQFPVPRRTRSHLNRHRRICLTNNLTIPHRPSTLMRKDTPSSQRIRFRQYKSLRRLRSMQHPIASCLPLRYRNPLTVTHRTSTSNTRTSPLRQHRRRCPIAMTAEAILSRTTRRPKMRVSERLITI